ncbi:unnamed protein product [Protopolystoma xenopodis]|uniref:Anaphase-promoting complex subunit 4 WD40 domain-containing protein n=1 Tax=Protopolystoma xenopodis TaxID=117903 RepID=A0A3S4ZZ73_9PLAT|nr:unnamed protein product [Protopolystoma xenopodis]
MRILSHHIGFYDYQPSTYSCLCVSESGFIAAGRCDGSLEVYQDLGDLFLISRIPPGILCSVESLAWLDKRLFTCGGSGALLELNIKNGQIKVGNDGGYISVIHATESELELEKTLPKLCGKVLCLALHKNQLAAGSNDGVLRVFNWKTSTILHSFNLDSCDKSNKPIIWCLIFARCASCYSLWMPYETILYVAFSVAALIGKSSLSL